MILLTVVGFLSSSASFAATKSCEDIQKLVDDAPRGNARVLIPEGDYLCKNPIVIDRNNLHLVGAGVGKVRIKIADHANIPAFIIGDIHTPTQHSIKGVEVSGFSVDGNKENQEYECWGHEPCEDPKFPRSAIRNNGITLRGASNISIHDVALDNNRSGGLVTEHHVDNLNVSKMSARHNFFDGLAIYETTHSVFSDMDLSENTHGSGISADWYNSDITFKDSRLENNKDNGVFARNSNGLKMTNCKVHGNRNFGVFTAWSSGKSDCVNDMTISHSEISNNKNAAVKQIGADCTGNKVMHTHMSGNGVDSVVSEAKVEVINSGPDMVKQENCVNCALNHPESPHNGVQELQGTLKVLPTNQ